MQETATTNAKKSSQTVPSTLMFSSHIRVTFMVAFINIVTIGLLGFGGYQIDLLYNTKPMMTLLGVVIAFPLSQYAVFKWVKSKYLPHVKSKK
ncbi:MAG: AtpZ/AtpI family protein [Candidatus Gracilibacteria bacterium]|nr:AtpZ/AtpI family protein [Candidatus Gracilibacteria bacterium]